jgi:hypothetical protein
MVVEFHEDHGTYAGTAVSGRRWLITRSLTGWRLEFKDAGDTHSTYAGNHSSLVAAKVEAGK